MCSASDYRHLRYGLSTSQVRAIDISGTGYRHLRYGLSTSQVRLSTSPVRIYRHCRYGSVDISGTTALRSSGKKPFTSIACRIAATAFNPSFNHLLNQEQGERNSRVRMPQAPSPAPSLAPPRSLARSALRGHPWPLFCAARTIGVGCADNSRPLTRPAQNLPADHWTIHGPLGPMRASCSR